MRPLHHQTWETFSVNWHTDVKIAFIWLREALLQPLPPGSRVVVVSSGAAINGSPASGGYAGAKATQRFIAGYAQEEARRADLDISITTVLPRMTPFTEVAGIVTDLYSRLARHRIALKLVDRCAPELPDLAEVWFGTGRDAQVDAVQAYLVHRERAGHLSLPGPAPVVARTIVELCALWAVHRHFDPAPKSGSIAGPSDDAVAATLAEFVARATTAAR